MEPVTTSPAGTGGASAPKGSLKERAYEELKAFLVIAAYLWVLFATFSLYRQTLIHDQPFHIWQQGFALINALVFGKVILIADALKLGGGLRRLPLVWVVLGRSFLFAIVLVLFHIFEESVRGWITGTSPLGDVPPVALVIYAAIFFVALLPFFAVQEAARILGREKLQDLFFGDGETYRLTKV